MNIYLIDPEPSEQAFLDAALPGHTLHFLTSAREVPADVELLSVFINVQIDAAFLAAHPALRFIATRSTTHDHIDLAECERRGVTVCLSGRLIHVLRVHPRKETHLRSPARRAARPGLETFHAS